MNNIPHILFALVLCVASSAAAQSELDALVEEIISETLSEDGFITLGDPIEVEEVQPEISDEADFALLRGLDRINGTVEDITIKVGETLIYERLELTLLACRYPQGDINEDAFAQLVITDVREESPRFVGWMFASSPALSALDHSRYDVWVLSCQNS